MKIFNTNYVASLALAIALLFSTGPAMAQVQIASDNTSNYGGDNPAWATGANGGTGFGAWVLTAVQGDGNFAGSFIGDPGNAGMNTMPNPSFALYANPNVEGNYSGAARPFAAPLAVGQTFSILVGFNWDSDNGNGTKGLTLYGGGVDGTPVIEIVMANSSAISINGQPMFNEYGTAPMNFTFEHVTAGDLRVQAIGRNGTEVFDEIITVSAAPDAFEVFAQRLNGGDARQPYFNNMSIVEVTSTDIVSGFETPDRTSLDQNYPNPFNPTTQIRFSLPQTSAVTLQVFDLLGRQVAQLADGTFAAGSHIVNFDASQLNSGVYVYRLQSDAVTITRKMTLTK